MSEKDVVFDALYAIRDRGLPQPQMGSLRERTDAALQREIERESDRRRWLPVLARPRRPSLAVLGLGVSSLVVVAVFVAGVVLLRHRGVAEDTGTPASSGLIARLAVLRRPQTAADRLPAGVKLPPGDGKLIPGLTRLLATPHETRLFLVVTRPLKDPNALWSPKLGDQVSIVALTRYGTSGTRPIPAADLSDPQQARFVGIGIPARHSPHLNRAAALKDVYFAGVVPDGVAYVRWTFGNLQGRPIVTRRLPASDNIAYLAYTQLRPRAGRLLHATWYAANGSVIPTSNQALRQAVQAQQNEQRAQILRTLSHEPAYHAPAGLLADFTIFGITSRTGVRIRSGVIISRLRLSSVPVEALDLIQRQYSVPPGAGESQLHLQPVDPDLTQIRQIASAAGLAAIVVPGRHGLCLFAVGLDGASGSCQRSIAQAEQGGVGESVGQTSHAGGQTTHTGTYYILVSKSNPTTKILAGPGKWRTIRPLDGVYIGPGYPEG